MARHIKVVGIRRKDPDVRLFVLALIELARDIEAKERARKSAEAADQTPGGDL